ncbi:MAG: FAD-dependent oxidoreductase, partial [Pseudomonadota bacterium]
AWAVDTLEAHASDPREQRLDWESLARGCSGSELWDLAQRSLLRQGELHNNLRMTWGKAVLDWTGGPDEALANLFDLNHRYALDGNDPNSYGGILWCLGQFDRPFSPEVSVTGTVRPRSVRAHERRLDVDAYRQKVEPPAGGRRLRCVVIGAGISGLTAARTLADHGHEVVVVEKGRGPGGRASTRRSEGLRFDHGAQYFTARDDRFRRHVLAWRDRGIVAPLTTPIGVAEGGTLRAETREHERWVGVPGMSAICATLAKRLDCRFGWRVEALERGDRTTLTNDSGDSLEADVVILTAPPIQAEALLADFPVALPRLPVLAPCWAVLAEFDRSLLPGFGGVFVNEGPLSWVSAMRGRPGRPDREGWVLHASPAWSRKHLEDPADHVAAALLAAARAIPGAEAVEALETSAHRWRYAIADAPRHDGALWFEEAGLALCGDWLHGSRVEGAFLAGASAAGRVLGSRLALGR